MEKEKNFFFGSLIKGDNWLWGVYWALLFISVTEMASATSILAIRTGSTDNPLFAHTKMLIVGFFCCVFFFQSISNRRIDLLKMGSVLIYFAGIGLMALLPFFGREVNGAKRDICGIQPVELCKVGLILTLVFFVTLKNADLLKYIPFYREKTELKKFWTMFCMIAVACLLIAIQNLSSALILGATSFGIMLLGGVNLKYLRNLVLVGLVAGGVAFSGLYGLHAYHTSTGQHVSLGLLKRAHTWENRIFDGDKTPLWEQRINDDNMQVMYAHMAIANSNGIGTFIGNSVLRDHLPEAYSDYIFSIIFEETGIEGAAVVMFLYFFLFFRCFYLATKTNNAYRRLLMIAIPLLIILQALIHMGVCTDAMFVTGQPLPLLSRGGMSILSTSVCFGILFGTSNNILSEMKDRENNEEKA